MPEAVSSEAVKDTRLQLLLCYKIAQRDLGQKNIALYLLYWQSSSVIFKKPQTNELRIFGFMVEQCAYYNILYGALDNKRTNPSIVKLNLSSALYYKSSLLVLFMLILRKTPLTEYDWSFSSYTEKIGMLYMFLPHQHSKLIREHIALIVFALVRLENAFSRRYSFEPILNHTCIESAPVLWCMVWALPQGVQETILEKKYCNTSELHRRSWL